MKNFPGVFFCDTGIQLVSLYLLRGIFRFGAETVLAAENRMMRRFSARLPYIFCFHIAATH
jgi:hypothetical protein